MTSPIARRPFTAPALMAAAFALAASTVQADPMDLIDPALPGSTAYSEWTSFTPSSYPGYGNFPGLGSWPSPMADQGGDAEAVLTKVSNGTGGGPYPASSALYFGGVSSTPNTNGGTLSVIDTAALAGLKQVTFQIQIAEAWGYDFWNDAFPTLSYNGGSQALTATSRADLERYPNGSMTVPGGGEVDISINTYLLSWDLSGVSDPISSFAITFTGVQHALVYKLRVDESDAVAVAAVPEPSSMAMLAGGGALTLLARRRFIRRDA